ncbi:hypothetical protein DFA_05759 [Cavenderia fasciculata]|uniref:C3HC-type domain-containing protein n=1 Tax=Cavenderia fasciculata TaxID=261658 RepID=F4PMH8_CACFS|nr:uncharacterized protein DFA_05759 [Cavenderia fasciculata]EGG23625.1 hypothetical protein DFA_05759 [Cavenderia fasciculata]|eukprot:XP_004361476.1 hypothetical protein DFA_05759 [Cavenderia fasciculata]
MEDRIKNALTSLDNVTLIHTPLNTNNVDDNATHQHASSSSSSTVDKQDSSSSSSTSNNNQILDDSSSILFRPWDSNDYYRRVKSFTISRWFAKPVLVDPLQCARFGWINCDVDMLECTMCSKRLYYNIAPSLSACQTQKRVIDFSNQVKTTGHRETCPWRDNGSPSFYARLINVPSKTLIESYMARVNNIYKNLNRFPDIDTTFWGIVQKKENNNLLTMIIKEAGILTDSNNTKDIKLKVACIIALCGWDYYKGDDHNNNNNASSSSSTTREDSVCCSYCQRVCGMWNFTELSTDPFKDIYPHLSDKTISDNNSTTSKFKRNRSLFEQEERVETTMSSVIDRILSFSGNNNNNSNNNNNNSGFNVTNSEGVYTGFSDTKRTKPPSDLGWSWGTSFSHQSTSLSSTIEFNQKRLKPFSPINEHRWFCPWIIFSKEEIQDEQHQQQQQQQTNQSSTTTTTLTNNNNNNNLNESQESEQKEKEITKTQPDEEPCGWESLLQLLTKKQLPGHTERKIHDIDVRATLKLWQ